MVKMITWKEQDASTCCDELEIRNMYRKKNIEVPKKKKTTHHLSLSRLLKVNQPLNNVPSYSAPDQQ